jgi:probable addiction module antidote protein
MINSAFASKDVERLLNAAFETNDLQNICRAVDAAVLRSGSIIEIARAAQIDRVTLYRAFRRERGPALDNMIKVLRVLGFRLIVELRCELENSHEGVPAEGWSSARKRAAATARRFTAAFKTGEMDALVEVFKDTLRAQENVAEFASKTIRTREALYRVFTQNPMPRFRTLLSFLSALELQFAVRRLPHK